MKIIKALISKFKDKKYLEYAGIVLILFALTVVLYPKVFFSGNIISSSDFLLIWEPWKHLITQPYAAKNYVISDLIEASYPLATHILNGLKSGEIPLWYSLSGMGSSTGAAFLATFLTNPVVLILSIINNFNIGYGLSTAVIFFSVFRGFFTYLLLREFGLKRFSSLLGAVIFTFCLYNVVWGLDALSHVASVIPFCLWATERLFKKISKLNIIFFAVSYTFLILGGFPSTIFYSTLLIGLYIVSKSVYRFIKKRESLPEVFKRLGIFLATGIVSVGLTAFTLVPTAESLLAKSDLSYRTTTHSGVYFSKFYLIRYFVPGLIGNPIHYDYQQAPFQPSHSTNFSESAGYVGVISLILAFFSFLKFKKDKKVLFFAAVSLFAILIAFKFGPFLDIVKKLPVFSSNPSTRLILIPSFGLSILAAYGLDAILTEKNKKKLEKYFLVSLVIGINVTLLLFLYISRFTNGFELIDKRIYFELAKYILLVINGFLLIYFLIKKTFKEFFVKAGIIVLVFLDLFFIGKGYLPQIPKDQYYPTPASIKFLENKAETSKFRILGFDEIFLSATPAVYGLNSITQMTHYDARWENFTNLLQPDSLELARKTVRFRKYKTDLTGQLIDFANVKYLLDYQGGEAFSERPFAEVKDFDKIVDLTGTDVIEQTFTAPANTDITSIRFWVNDVEKSDNTALIIKILDENGKVISESRKESVDPGENVIYDSHRPVDIKTEGKYTLKLNWETNTANKIFFYAASPTILYKEGELSKNGVIETGNLTFSIAKHDSAMAEKYNLVYDNEIKIYENKDVFDRAFLVHNAVNTQTADKSFEQLKALSSSKSLDETAIIENTNSVSLNDCTDNSIDKTDIKSYTSNKVEIESESRCDSILVFTDLYDSDWNVYVDGNKSDLLLTDYLVRGVHLSSGNHTVIFRYEPASVKIGGYISLVSLTGVIVFALPLRKKKAKKS